MAVTRITHWVDITVICLYFAFVAAVGIMSMCRKNRESVKGYFLAGRNMIWLPIGASMFASNIGSEHFIGLAGSGAASGIAVVAFEWGAVILLLLLGWVFLPIYLTSGVYTMPEYLGRRFGGNRMRTYLSLIALLLYILTKISVDIYAGAVFIQQAIGLNLYLSVIPLLIITALYTIAGGLAAVVFTDTLQTVVMLVGAIVLAVIAFVDVGGLPGLYYKYMEAIPEIIKNGTLNTTCGLPRDDAFHILRDPVHSDLPWPGVIIRSTIASLWNWCADQVIVQRALASKNMAHAKGATILTGYLKFIPLFIIIMPGMISRILFTEQVACADAATCLEVCGNAAGCSNVAYPTLVLGLAPIGMRGLLMAVMIAALMSSLTSIFNSAATIFTMDIWRRVKPQASEKQLLIAGRISVIVLVAVSLCWIPLILSYEGGQLFIYIQAITGYIAPPICAIFILAIFVPRTNEAGAFWGVLSGQLAGITRLILDFTYPAPGCGKEDTRPLIVSKVHFTYFSGIIIIITTVVTLIVSYCTEAQPQDQIKGLTFWSVRKMAEEEDRNATNGLNKESPLLKENKSTERAKGVEEDPESTENAPPANLAPFSQRIEKPWNIVLDINAVILLLVFIMLYGFFA
ncbi:hypothetical protein SNE40_017042 [Patella caerulea]|uniref:Uncharacterized protein n=1 Tax=Patella caerulea TaxID=87958 RepID=A0AAN8PPI2_PATCE